MSVLRPTTRDYLLSGESDIFVAAPATGITPVAAGEAGFGEYGFDVGAAAPVAPGSVTLSPTGIASTEALGAAVVSLTLAPSGIASDEALGAPVVSLTVAPSGIPSDEAFGAAIVTAPGVISPGGIASGEALGSPVVAGPITATGIPSDEAFGAATVSIAGFTLAPTSIASGEALGAASVSVTLAPGGIASAEAFGITVVAGPITATGIPSAETFGPGTTVGAFGITLVPTDPIVSYEAFGTPTLIYNQILSPVGITGAGALGSAKVTRAISPGGVPSAEALGAVVVSRPTIVAQGIGPASVQTGIPTLTTGSTVVVPTGFFGTGGGGLVPDLTGTMPVPTPIPDLTITNVPFTFSGTGAVNALVVDLYIEHTYIADMAITLIHPDLTQVALITLRGGVDDNIGTRGNRVLLKDSATTPVSALVGGVGGAFIPEQPLSVLNGKSTSGTWTLRIEDTAAGDVGTLIYGAAFTQVVTNPVIFGSTSVFLGAAPTGGGAGAIGGNGSPLPRAVNRLRDPAAASAYDWIVNHSAEEAVIRRRGNEYGAASKSMGLDRDLTATGHLALKWSGVCLESTQVTKLEDFYNLCESVELELTDYTGDSYKVIVTSLDIHRRQGRSSRYPGKEFIWAYTIEFTATEIRSAADILVGVGV